MDIGGALASVLWTDRVPPKAVEKPQSLEELAELISAEGDARKVALAEAQKQLDWRFVHFADEFQRRLDRLEARCGALPEGSREAPAQEALDGRPGAPEARDPAGEQRLHLLEGKLAIAEARVADVQRWGKNLEAQYAEEQQTSSSRLAEAEAFLAHMDRRLGDVEFQLGGRRGAEGRLTPVERLTLEGRPPEARHSAISSSMSAHSVGSGGSNARSNRTDQSRGLVSSPLVTVGEGCAANATRGEAAGFFSDRTKVPTGNTVSPASSRLAAAAPLPTYAQGYSPLNRPRLPTSGPLT